MATCGRCPREPPFQVQKDSAVCSTPLLSDCSAESETAALMPFEAFSGRGVSLFGASSTSEQLLERIIEKFDVFLAQTGATREMTVN